MTTDPALDFPVHATVTVASEDELRDAFASYDAVRLAGSGSAQARLPTPDREVTVVRLDGMQRIVRLEADDLTCSVEPGVRRRDLDAALEEKGLWLPCAGDGTLGGLFAADETGPRGPAGPEPRSLLLGMSAMLAEGKTFHSGARVVKNVAGFDLQKLFVGSRGRLFAATELHLKLRPRPRGIVHFANPELGRDEALDLAGRLRRHPTRPAALGVAGNASLSVCGTLTGDPDHLGQLTEEFALHTVEGPPADAFGAASDERAEVIAGQIRFRRLRELLSLLPESAAFRHYGERFTVRLPARDTDAFLDALGACGAAGEVVGGEAPRRGHRTAGDPVADRVGRQLKDALDPRGILR